jgi:hypothetical protein
MFHHFGTDFYQFHLERPEHGQKIRDTSQYFFTNILRFALDFSTLIFGLKMRIVYFGTKNVHFYEFLLEKSKKNVKNMKKRSLLKNTTFALNLLFIMHL